MSVIRHSHVAMYNQIAEKIAAAIQTGTYPPLSKLPTEPELMKEFGVSRVTIRQALQLLLEQNLVVRKQGKGTFASGPLVRQDLAQLQGFHDALVAKGIQPQTRLLEYRLVIPPPGVRNQLELREGDPVVYMMRHYRVGEGPLAIASTHLPARVLDLVSREQAESNPSYSILDKFLGIQIGHARLGIRAEQAGTGPGRMLGLSASEATLLLERVSYDKEGQPVEHTVFYLRSDAYEFSLTVRGGVTLASRIHQVLTK